MDPIEIVELCKRGAHEGAPHDVIVPRVFSVADYEAMWRRDPARVRRLLDELLCAPHAGDGLELLMRSGAIDALFPELRAIKDLGDDPASSLHKDVWEHSKMVVMGVVPIAELRWAALMHDIGKSRTRRFVGNKVTFHNHDVVGARMLDRIEQRLDLFRDDATLFTTVRSLVLNHLRPAGYKASWSDSGVRRLLTDLGGLRNFERLMVLSRADLTTKNANKRNQAHARGDELEVRVRLVYAEASAPKLPKGTMGAILERSGRKPGKWLNELRDELEERMASGLLDGDGDVEHYATIGLDIIKDASSA